MTPPHVLLVTINYLLCCLILKVVTGSTVISPCLITLTGFLFMGWTKALKCIWETPFSSHNHGHNLDVATDYLISRLILKEITGSSASSPCLDFDAVQLGGQRHGRQQRRALFYHHATVETVETAVFPPLKHHLHFLSLVWKETGLAASGQFPACQAIHLGLKWSSGFTSPRPRAPSRWVFTKLAGGCTPRTRFVVVLQKCLSAPDRLNIIYRYYVTLASIDWAATVISCQVPSVGIFFHMCSNWCVCHLCLLRISLYLLHVTSFERPRFFYRCLINDLFL